MVEAASGRVSEVGRWAGISLLAAGVLLGTYGTARAQEEPEGGVAGSQMVRGTVTAVTGDHLQVKTDRGDAYEIALSGNTRIMKDRQPLKVAEIKAGDSVGAMGVLDAPTHTVHAVFLMVVDAEQARKMREGLGKVYITGKVTAIDELKLTVQRPDGVSQVIAVDEGTSFRKGGRGLQAMINGSGPVDGNTARSGSGAPQRPDGGGESITLADIKVGDNVAGQGELKAGTFVPTQLAVMDPSARRKRRPDGAGTGGAGTGPGVSPPQPR